MKFLSKALIFLSVVAASGGATWGMAQLLHLGYKIAFLVAMILVYIIASAYLEFSRYRLRKQVERMAPDERAVRSEFEPEICYAIPASGSASPRLTTLIGAVLVNGPIVPLMIGPLALLQYVFGIQNPWASAFTLVLGFLLAWTWWSVGVTVWRWWATAHRGMPAGEVQWRGQEASLLWPRDHFFSKTELGYLLSRRRVPQ